MSRTSPLAGGSLVVMSRTSPLAGGSLEVISCTSPFDGGSLEVISCTSPFDGGFPVVMSCTSASFAGGFSVAIACTSSTVVGCSTVGVGVPSVDERGSSEEMCRPSIPSGSFVVLSSSSVRVAFECLLSSYITSNVNLSVVASGWRADVSDTFVVVIRTSDLDGYIVCVSGP